VPQQNTSTFKPSPQPSRQPSEQTIPKHQEAFLTQGEYDDSGDEEAPPLPTSPPPQFAGGAPQGRYVQEVPEREYTNLKDVRRESEVSDDSLIMHII